MQLVAKKSLFKLKDAYKIEYISSHVAKRLYDLDLKDRVQCNKIILWLNLNDISYTSLCDIDKDYLASQLGFEREKAIDYTSAVKRHADNTKYYL